jgi:NADH-quinone oxidoreductase subunit C
MTPEAIIEKLKARHAAAVLASDPNPKHPFVKVAPAAWREVAKTLRDELGMDYLVCLTAIDRGAELEAFYHLEHIGDVRYGIGVRVLVPRDNPVIPSVENVWRTSDWHEREAWDLMGIRFEGHHNLVRILCAEDWEGHPLRKDYKSPDYYHGVKNNVV